MDAHKRYSFSISAEELALAFGLMDHPQLGQNIMKSMAGDLSPDQVGARLTAASHSLLARGLCSIPLGAKPVLQKEFERTISALIKFDYLFQFSNIRPNAEVSSAIHVSSGKYFTSHSVDMGVVHVLEQAGFDNLLDYLVQSFEGPQSGSNTSKEMKGGITPGILGSALKQSQQEITNTLVQRGWKSMEAQDLAEDIRKQIVRATILFLKINNANELDNPNGVPARSFLFLKGPKHSWVFQFPSAADEVEGTAIIVDRATFMRLLSDFLASVSSGKAKGLSKN